MARRKPVAASGRAAGKEQGRAVSAAAVKPRDKGREPKRNEAFTSLRGA